MSNPIISDPEAPAAHVAAHHWPMLAFQFSRCCDFSQLSLPVLWVVSFQGQVGGLCLLLKFAMLLPQL